MHTQTPPSTHAGDVSLSTPRWVYALVAAWGAAVFAGLVLIWNYAATPAAIAKAAPQWPANTQISLNATLPTLVMFIHPQCPCTRASIAELAKIAAQTGGHYQGWVVAYLPADAEDDFAQTDLVKSAAEIPGVEVVRDADGQLARLFEATTSGHTLVYDAAGNLQFSGGITEARGHAGDNLGEAAVVALLNGKQAPVTQAPIFGCPIIE